ncbi:MAG: MinD/ParA family protein [Nevskiaceae bacterium]|nr:MAG: MinD/ParA family protein [Nevskiaceae bacterium]TBR72183.1 MAG: MinD/ParA family protein [Nevskiaceae bacterium]
MNDQAMGLRSTAAVNPKVRVIAVSSGKGGVGKTTISVNLSMALAEAGQHTLLLDADLGLANVDVLLGLQPRYNLSHVLAGECGLKDTILEAPHGLQIVPAASGKEQMAQLTTVENAGLIQAFSQLKQNVDVLVIDTGAGISSGVTTFVQAAQDVMIVALNEPASITDAYALMKVLSREHGVSRFQIIANQVRSDSDGRNVFDNLRRVAERFLDVQLVHFGNIPHDDWVRRAIRKQRAVVDLYPNSVAAAAFRALAGKVLEMPAPQGARGNLEFFIERLVAPPAARSLA